MDTTPHKRARTGPLVGIPLLVVLAVSPLLLDVAMHALGTRAFTLVPGVVCYRSDVDLESGVGKALQRHEAAHEQQMRDYGILRFWASYICECFNLPSAYSRMEEDAKKVETEEWLTCRYIDFGSKPPWSTDEEGLPWLDRKEARA